jgi:hypothetical protein
MDQHDNCGLGPGGTIALNASTVQRDDTANTLSDRTVTTQVNWFIAGSSDKVTKKANETQTIV